MYRSSTGSSMRNLAKGSAGLWLQRSPIEFLTPDVEKIAKLDAQFIEVRQIVVEDKVQDMVELESIDMEPKNEPKKVESSQITNKVLPGDCMTKQDDKSNKLAGKNERNKKDKEIELSKDKEIELSKDKEIELLKEQLKLLGEKNVHLETSLDEVKVINHDLRQEIDNFNVTAVDKMKAVEKSLSGKTNEVNLLKEEAGMTSGKLKTLQDSLSGKTNKVNLLKEQLDIQAKDHQVCKKELNETKNQLYYKHLALDGVIKSNIKLQEQLASTVVNAACEQILTESSFTRKTAVSILKTGPDDVIKSNNKKQELTTVTTFGRNVNEKTTAQQTAVSLKTNDASIVPAVFKNAGRDKSIDVATTTPVGRLNGPNNKKQNKRGRRNKKRFQ